MVREAARRALGHAPLRRPADRRHRAARGQDRRDEDRRGQDPGRDPAGLPATRSTGKGVHVVTVNDYLARRDAEWMGAIYRFLGLTRRRASSTTCPTPSASAAYAADITYGTNNEFGFDYLRDNMKFDARRRMVQRGHHYAIVDEVDSILIDEARTPLIISGPVRGVDRQVLPHRPDRPAPGAGRGDRARRRLEIDQRRLPGRREGPHRDADRRRRRQGREAARASTTSTTRTNMDWCIHGINQALRAHTLYKRDVDYVIKDGQVVIVDEFTGRLMPGRRWSDGLHQAVEAKEGVQDRAREPDPGHDHLPELLPHVRQAGRHDRHRRDRGGRVRQDLRARRGR